jgi:hypothetical protein
VGFWGFSLFLFWWGVFSFFGFVGLFMDVVFGGWFLLGKFFLGHAALLGSCGCVFHGRYCIGESSVQVVKPQLL